MADALAGLTYRTEGFLMPGETNGLGIRPLTNLSLFSGAGGLDLGARLVGGIKTVGYVEFDRYAQGVLMSRIRDGGLDDAPIWDDVTTFDARPWRGKVDIVSGGFPCQDVSQAGKRAGITNGTRSGLWRDFARIICDARPRFVLVENVTGLLNHGGIGVVLGDLAAMGFDAQWYVLSAGAVGAPQIRERVFIIAVDNEIMRHGLEEQDIKKKREYNPPRWNNTYGLDLDESWPGVCEPQSWRVDNGVASRVDRVGLCGNGVVPQQSAPAWQAIVDMAKNIGSNGQ